MNTGILQLEPVIKETAAYLAKLQEDGDETYQYGYMSQTNPNFYEIEEINYGGLTMDTNQNVDYSLQVAGNNGIPKEEVVYNRTVNNSTSRDQVEKFTVESSVSSIDVNLTSGVSFGPNCTIGIPLKIQDKDVKNRFGPKVMITGQSQQHMETKSAWSTTDEITIPEYSKVNAKVVITSKQYQTDFELVTSLKGPVGVVMRNQDTGKVIGVQVDFYEAIMRQNIASRGGTISSDKRKKLILVRTTGTIDFRVALDKKMDLKEYSL